jgi:hypothetical protein
MSCVGSTGSCLSEISVQQIGCPPGRRRLCGVLQLVVVAVIVAHVAAAHGELLGALVLTAAASGIR